MKEKIIKILKLSNFFKLIKESNNKVLYHFETPSKLLMQNIHISWLRFLNAKSHKDCAIFLNKSLHDVPKDETLPFGLLNQEILAFDRSTTIEHKLTELAPIKSSSVGLKLFVPHQDSMQHFIQWQRYRKYWWSSITTTPSLFGLSDIKYEDNKGEVDIVAKFPWGQQIVETVAINSSNTIFRDTSCLDCAVKLEGALIVLLMDSMNNNSDYLRLHRTMAPYKISFALQYQDSTKKQTLTDLATLIYNRLQKKKISAWLPDFIPSMDAQLKENLRTGVVYTAILSERTLVDGIFHLFNSSTTLKEQVHIADFDDYAALLFGRR